MSLLALANDYTSKRETQRLSQLTLKPIAPMSVMSLLGTSATDNSGNTVTADTGSQQFVQAIMKYVPTEIISAYLVLVGLAPAGTPVDVIRIYLWVIFWICLVLCPLLVFALSYASTKVVSGGAVDSPVLPWFQMIAGAVAFVLWASVLPNSIVIDGSPIASWEGVAAIVIGTIVLHILGTFFGGNTPSQPTHP